MMKMKAFPEGGEGPDSEYWQPAYRLYKQL